MVHISHGKQQILLGGDSTAITTQQAIVDSLLYSTNHPENPVSLRADVLLASHHGAPTEGSNASAFMKWVRPKILIFSSGENNDYRHPKKIVAQRFHSDCNYLLAPLGTVHPLTFNVGSTIRDPIIEYRGSIYSTYDQDDIVMKWKKNESIIEMDTGFIHQIVSLQKYIIDTSIPAGAGAGGPAVAGAGGPAPIFVRHELERVANPFATA